MGLRTLWLLPVAFIAACGGIQVGTGSGYDQRYTGLMTPTGGAHCDPAAPAMLILSSRSHAVSFIPGDGVLVIQGTIAADGSIGASLNTQPPGHPPFRLTLAAVLAGEHVTGTYLTPLCRYRLALAPAEGPRPRIFAPKNPLGL